MNTQFCREKTLKENWKKKRMIHTKICYNDHDIASLGEDPKVMHYSGDEWEDSTPTTSFGDN